MSHLVFFGIGIAVGVVYEKSIRAWKNKLGKAAQAVQRAMQD